MARRGELIVAAPAGFLKTEDHRLEKDPDRRVQEAVRLVFDKFVEVGAVRQTLLWFLEHGLQLPVSEPGKDLTWKRPTYPIVYRILTHPAYGGAYAYGKTETVTRYENNRPRKATRRKPMEQWLSLIPESHEGYVSWEQFEKVRRQIAENFLRPGNPGSVKRGSGLLVGLLRCRRCGRKLIVHYMGRDADVLRYSCYRGWLDKGEPRCISFGGVGVDKAIGLEALRVVQPGAVEAAIVANQEEVLDLCVLKIDDSLLVPIDRAGQNDYQ